MSNFRSMLIRLAYAKPELRQHLLPLVRQASMDEPTDEMYKAFAKEVQMKSAWRSDADALMDAAMDFTNRWLKTHPGSGDKEDLANNLYSDQALKYNLDD